MQEERTGGPVDRALCSQRFTYETEQSVATKQSKERRERTETREPHTERVKRKYTHAHIDTRARCLLGGWVSDQ